MNAAREHHATGSGRVERLWQLLGEVHDPEIPVLTILDLGIVRDVLVTGEEVTVQLTPTYTGCPATEVIEDTVRRHLQRNGFPDVRIERLLSPPWTTDWLTDAGREKLLAYGIVPPERTGHSKRTLLGGDPAVACPRCASTATQRVSEFGSTPCKSAWKCDECLEPFEYFKCL